MAYTWASARRIRCVFLALISLSVLSVLVVSSRMGVASRAHGGRTSSGRNLQLFEHLYPQYLHVAKAVKKVSLADMARYALLASGWEASTSTSNVCGRSTICIERMSCFLARSLWYTRFSWRNPTRLHSATH
ncbi:hypothetical protein DVH05_012545 [Phytophthora capsici]|nr:hypothetical protein DVH05_012545 [Phytophthora capsici]